MLLQFSTLEALANFIADLTVQAHEGLEGASSPPRPLTQVELDFLQERRSSVEPRNGNVKIQNGAYVSTLDKLSVAPPLSLRTLAQPVLSLLSRH